MSGAFGQDEFAAVTAVSRETLERFEAWRVLLETWNTRINLVGASTISDFWRRHALDSIQLLELAPADARLWIDLGSGAGFPGLAIAIALVGRSGDGAVHLVESNAKKAAFLRAAVRITGASAVVRNIRAESLAGETFDVVTARAFAPLTKLLGYADSFWTTKTVGLFLKGQDVAVELTGAHKSWCFECDLVPSRSDPDGRIVRIQGLAHAAHD